MNTLTTLPTAILQFAFTGVFGPHMHKPADYEPARVASTSRRVFIQGRA